MFEMQVIFYVPEYKVFASIVTATSHSLPFIAMPRITPLMALQLML